MKTYTVKVDEYGTKHWYLGDKLHREDGPAMEFVLGTKYWYIGDKLHREDGPAVEWANGSKYWYRNGKLHREDGPAMEHANGAKFWFLDGKRLTETAWKKKVVKPCCADNKLVEIDGVKYKLVRA